MDKDFFILKKPEVFSFDEICFFRETVLACNSLENRDILAKKLDCMAKAIEAKRNDTAIFFMPKETYDVFSIFQGQTALCDFTRQDTQLLVDSIGQNASEDNKKIAEHIMKKLKVLNDFLQEGHSVVPVPSKTSEFAKL